MRLINISCSILFITVFLITSCTAPSSQQQEQEPIKKEETRPVTTAIQEVIAPPMISGMFNYFADSNMFFPCDGSARLPVIMEGAYLELEKKYLSLVDGPTKVYVEVEGYIKEISSISGKVNNQKLFVSKIRTISKEKSCSN